jgi:hypothetical protein
MPTTIVTTTRQFTPTAWKAALTSDGCHAIHTNMANPRLKRASFLREPAFSRVIGLAAIGCNGCDHDSVRVTACVLCSANLDVLSGKRQKLGVLRRRGCLAVNG